MAAAYRIGGGTARPCLEARGQRDAHRVLRIARHHVAGDQSGRDPRAHRRPSYQLLHRRPDLVRHDYLFALAHVPIVVAIDLLPLDRWIDAARRRARAVAAHRTSPDGGDLRFAEPRNESRWPRPRTTRPGTSRTRTEWRDYLRTPVGRHMGDRRVRRRQHRRDRTILATPEGLPGLVSSASTATAARGRRSPPRSAVPGWNGSCSRLRRPVPDRQPRPLHRPHPGRHGPRLLRRAAEQGRRPAYR